jgi:pimeloyl-ACP methyl ester carboxylesterase
MFAPSHRGGSGEPLVLLHGFSDTWRTWERVLPALEREHDVLALTLAGHSGGPAIAGDASERALLDGIEHALDAAGLERAHFAGNSLGGYLALQLAARRRALSVVAFAPAGGWAPGDDSFRDLLHRQRAMVETLHPPGLVALIEYGLQGNWHLDAERVDVPVRIVWGTDDEFLPWPEAAARYRTDWLPNADWVELDGVGHLPQLERPLETAQLILAGPVSIAPWLLPSHAARS